MSEEPPLCPCCFQIIYFVHVDFYCVTCGAHVAPAHAVGLAEMAADVRELAEVLDGIKYE